MKLTVTNALAAFGAIVIIGMFTDFKGIPVVGQLDYFE